MEYQGLTVGLWFSAVVVLLAIAMMWLARALLRPRWEHLAHRFPAQLLHRWSLGGIALLALYAFFCVPFLVLGAYQVAMVGFATATGVVALVGRDVVAWIVDDLREHLAERRGIFEHGKSCVVTFHYGLQNAQTLAPKNETPSTKMVRE